MTDYINTWASVIDDYRALDRASRRPFKKLRRMVRHGPLFAKCCQDGKVKSRPKRMNKIRRVRDAEKPKGR